MQTLRADERYRWRDSWLESHQSFPATGNFDLTANAHGVLTVFNDDTVDAGEGFDTHQHRNAEIVTWVLEGSLVHRDSAGNEGTLVPGVVQRMTAGRGISHSERNGSDHLDNKRLRVVQMWLGPDAHDLEPEYAERGFDDELASGDPVVAVSGLPRDADGPALSIGNRYAALHIARPHAGQEITLPGAPFGHLYVARGGVTVITGAHSDTLAVGDAIRFTDDPDITVTALEEAEILYWEMHASFDV